MKKFFILTFGILLITGCSPSKQDTKVEEDLCEKRFKKAATDKEKAYFLKYGRWSKDYQLMIDNCKAANK